MNARTTVTLLLLWLSAASLLSWAGRPQAPAVKPFSHAQHVPQAWLDAKNTPEVFRDCRGCHRFDKTHTVSSPQQQCGPCHIGGGTLTPQFTAGWQQDLDGYRTRTRDAFRHHTHFMLECRECHSPEFTRSKNAQRAGRARFENLYEHFELQTGPGQCARCHAGTAKVAEFRFFAGAEDAKLAAELGVEPYAPPAVAEYDAYAKKLVTVFAGPTGGLNTPKLPVGGDFDHGDHLGITCSDCHRNIPTATAAEVGTGAIPVDKCAECHIADAAKTPVRAAPGQKQQQRPLWSLGAFAHADHFAFLKNGRRDGYCKPAAYEAIEKQQCVACHTYDPEKPGRKGRDFPFDTAASKNLYLDCVGCHDVDGWRTGESKAAPLHSSAGGDGWKRCSDCHVLGKPDLKTVRPMVAVERFRQRTFVFAANTHPDITQAGIDKSGRPALEDCSKCHRARVPELTTRLVQKVFRHGSHLSATPLPVDCLQCHPRAGLASSSPDLEGADFRTYALANCTKCHWGGDVTETAVEGLAPTKSTVVAFPHGPHVTKAGQSCFECHAPAADGRDIVTKPEALACNQCHDHKEGGPKYEGLFGTVGSCAKCHHDPKARDPKSKADVASLPAVRGSDEATRDPRYHSAQSEFAGFADGQYHPLDRACTECHKANPGDDGGILGIIYAGSNHLSASHAGSVHAAAGGKKPQQCLRCHWTPTTGSWKADVNSAGGTEEEREFRMVPGSAATRARFGNSARGYPGTEQSEG